MSYETAPATILLATHCACCGRPLVDATSVEAGVGPECRRRHGYDDAQGEPDWAAAERFVGELADSTRTPREVVNRLVHRFACSTDRTERSELMGAIAALGYTTLARKLATQAAGIVKVLPAGDRLAIETPYRADFVAALKAERIGARWNRDDKVWTIPTDARARAGLWRALRSHFAGALLVTERGDSTVPAPNAQIAA